MPTDEISSDAAELLPCPFCGGEAGVFFAEETGFWDVQCQDCGAEPYPRKKDYEAIEAWNTRHERTCEGCLSPETDEWICMSCGGAIQGVVFDPERDGFVDCPRFCPNCGARVNWTRERSKRRKDA